MENLKKQRKLTKGAITRLKTFADAIVPETLPSIQELNIKVNLLQNSWADYKEIQRQIIELGDEDQFDAEERDFEEIENKYSNILLRLTQFIDELESTTQTPPSSGTNSDNGSTNSNQSQASSTVADVKLPKMDLPTFTGNQLEWESFRDLFTSIVHNNKKISDSQKLHYLKNALRQDAQVLLKSLVITDANYSIAWDILKERFENERQLIHCHLKSLFAQAQMSSECSIQLRKLIDTTNQHIRALKGFGLQTDHWDPIVIHVLTDKMDSESRREWELSSPGKSFPTLETLTSFLEQRCRALEVTNTSKQKHIQKPVNGYQQQKHNMKSHYSTQVKLSCPICKSQHHIYQCGEFSKLDSKSRSDAVKKNQLCSNCLRSNHSLQQCKSGYTCRICKGRHHSMLHPDRVQSQSSSDYNQTTSVSSNHSNNEIGQQVLLKTALVKVEDSEGNMITCRAFLDDGSQSSLITDACVRRLGLTRSKLQMTINGIGNSIINPCGKVMFTLHSLTSPFSIAIQATVLKNLTGRLPQSKIHVKNWTHLHNLQLADNKFNEPGDIDILLGADVYEHIMTDGVITPEEGIPTARRSHLGWVLSGKVSSLHIPSASIHIAVVDVADELRKFWELEDVGRQQHLTNEEQLCELSFKNSTVRDEAGRYTVSIPLNETCKPLGLSKSLCLSRLQSVERRLQKQPEYKTQYQKFMQEYLNLGHMELIPFQEQEEIPSITNYLPHHFVLKESTTTSLRVVFDASAKTSTGVSFNDSMLVGPTLQDDLHSILLRFRLPRYVFTADVAKMYRQIRVTTQDANLQRILWRNEPWLPVQEYRLTTVTYGTASAPYLATKSLRQLAEDDGHLFPLAKEATLSSFYVDDIMCGKDRLEDAMLLQNQLITMLKGGGFHLRKWSANNTHLLKNVPVEDLETAIPLSIDANDSIKALGLNWNPAADFLFFKVNLKKMQIPVTKRSLLSESARLFDPLGWLAPVIIIAKKMFQQLWLLGLKWDDSLTEDMQTKWIEFTTQLNLLENLRIPRHVGGEDKCKYQLHGFSDASESAYSAVLYLRAESQDAISTHLLTSKTKVAPVKQVSLPRLELCGATLLARLMDKVNRIFKIEFEAMYAWTDSTVTLAWISQHPSKWTTFVANRVSEVQSLLNPSIWRHVPSAMNPADCASRGLMPDELLNFKLWWNGPEWLALDSTHWPEVPKRQHATHLDQRKVKIMLITANTNWSFINKFSSLTKLKRVTAWIFRIFYMLKFRQQTTATDFFTTRELQHGLFALIRFVQQQEFSEVIQKLKKGEHSNHLASLNPFLDADDILRVGGRLLHSSLPSNQKHPMLLPKSHHLTKLIILDGHLKHMHAGPQYLLAALNRDYWIINGRNLIRQLIHKCIRCSRIRANMANQQMGNLPSFRVQASRAFLKTGVDYAGPLKIKSFKGRGGKIYKSYICLFICLSTKAIHIELATELSSAAFLAAFRRFASRRGKPTDMYSDNGTNFVGANAELKILTSLTHSQQFNTNISQELSNDGIMWHFTPAHAPHFGGLWEAGIKSMKKHLIRVVGEQILTFEELYTVLTQIEACLNSRPLCPLSTDPHDLSPLTPGHFLIGEPLTAAPDPDLSHIQLNRLSRWQLLQQMTQSFWKRWHRDYLTQLQQRSKWRKQQPNIKVGDLVIIKDENLPPLRWPMGRVEEIHPGKDNLVRAVTVKSVNGLLRRPIVKVCVLPIE